MSKSGNVLNNIQTLEEISRKIDLGYISREVAIKINKFARREMTSSNVELISSFNNPNPFLDDPEELYVVSTSPAETLEVEIFCTNREKELIKKVVTLNGQTSVPIGNDVYSVLKMTNNGSENHLGQISVSTELNPLGGSPDDENTYCAMPFTSGVASNTSFTSVFTVPKDFVGFIYDSAISAQKDGDLLGAFFTRKEGKVFKFEKALSVVEGTFANSFEVVLNEKTDVKIVGKSKNASIVYCQYTLLILKKDLVGEHIDESLSDIVP